MTKLGNAMRALLIFGSLIIIFVSIYSGLEDQYGITKTDTRDGEDIGDRMKNLNIIGGINQTATGLLRIAQPTGAADVLGGLASTGFGFVKTLGSLLTFPVEIVGVLTGFYYIPPIVPTAIIIFILIGFTFVMLAGLLGFEL